MPSVVMRSVVMLNVILLSVVAPHIQCDQMMRKKLAKFWGKEAKPVAKQKNLKMLKLKLNLKVRNIAIKLLLKPKKIPSTNCLFHHYLA